MSMRSSWWSAGALGLALVAVPACGKISTVTADGGGGGGDDGAAGVVDAEPGTGGLERLAGVWDFQLGDGTELTCVVTIDLARAWGISCPFTVRPPAPGDLCEQTVESLELSGTWRDLFQGEAFTHKEFQGLCPDPPKRTVDFEMMATQEETSGSGFLGAVGGTWAWEAHDPFAPADRLECSVTLTPGLAKLEYLIRCLDEPSMPSAGCTRQGAIEITGHVAPREFAGELAFVTTYTPSGCAEDTRDEPVQMSARRR